MALENYDNWQTGESNRFEEFIYGFVGLALICIIISIFYTPEQKTTDVNKSKTQQTVVKTQKQPQVNNNNLKNVDKTNAASVNEQTSSDTESKPQPEMQENNEEDNTQTTDSEAEENQEESF